MSTKFSSELKQDIINTYRSLLRDEENYYYYKYMSIDLELNSLKAIKENTLKFTLPKNFNDPYDCLTTFTIDGEKNSEHSQRMLELRDTYGVCSFAHDPLNILMWSHYANHHKGFVIEYKNPQQKLNNEPIIYPTEYAYPVKYTDNFPNFNVNFKRYQSNGCLTGEEHTEFMRKAFFTKAKPWEYERELRLIKNKKQCGINFTELPDGSFLHPYDPGELSSVICGAKITDEHKDLIIAAVDEFNSKHSEDVKILFADICETEFKIQIPNHHIIK